MGKENQTKPIGKKRENLLGGFPRLGARESHDRLHVSDEVMASVYTPSPAEIAVETGISSETVGRTPSRRWWCHRRLGLHLIGLLQTRRSRAEPVSDLLVPRSLDEVLRFLEHRLGFEVAIGVDLARGDGCHRGVNWFGIELSTRKG